MMTVGGYQHQNERIKIPWEEETRDHVWRGVFCCQFKVKFADSNLGFGRVHGACTCERLRSDVTTSTHHTIIMARTCFTARRSATLCAEARTVRRGEAVQLKVGVVGEVQRVQSVLKATQLYAKVKKRQDVEEMNPRVERALWGHYSQLTRHVVCHNWPVSAPVSRSVVN